MSGVLHRLQYRLSYGDCDPAGIVYYAAYYPWQERVYSEWTFVNGIASDRMLELWGASTVSRASGCEYLVQGKLFDLLHCEMHLADIGRTSYTLRFEQVRQPDGVVMAAGHMTLVFLGADGRPVPVPEPMKEHLKRAGPPSGRAPARDRPAARPTPPPTGTAA